jgi:hypothetical protein
MDQPDGIDLGSGPLVLIDVLVNPCLRLGKGRFRMNVDAHTSLSG